MDELTHLIEGVCEPLLGLPVYLAGSLVAAQVYDNPDGWSDVDFFCRTPETLMTAAARLQALGYTMDSRNTSTYRRWLRYGLQGWHTQSLKLNAPISDDEINLVWKTVAKKPLQSLAAVLESFDFGLLASGYTLEDGLIYRDFRPFMFPEIADHTGPLPMMPDKRVAWRRGQFSRYNGTREPWRYAKYASRGFDMSLVKDDLLVGYEEAILYWMDRGGAEYELLASIYEHIRDDIDGDRYDAIIQAGKEILHIDALDDIMDALNKAD